MVRLGRRGAGAGQRGGQADPAVDRLLGLPLVPRDGARVVRGCRDGRIHERALRQHQGRPRGAPRPRLHLHGGDPGDDGARRLAVDRLPRSRGRPVLRRHLLPARAPPGNAELPHGDGGGGRVVEHAAGARSAPRRRGSASSSARSAASSRPPSRSARSSSARAVGRLRMLADMRHGGFGQAPKFPPASALELLLAHGVNDVVEVTLDAMAHGGIYDQIGGGFARYSVDEVWLVPHFEKMLYDNALLARAYLHAWQALGHERWRRVCDRHARLGAARDARAGGRLLLGPRRRLRGRGGPLLPLDPGPDPRRARRRRPGPTSPTMRSPTSASPRRATSRGETSSTSRAAPAAERPERAG